MRVVVPATPNGLHPSTVPAILRQGWLAEVFPMLDSRAYFDLVAGLWEAGEGFAIVEHDIELGGGELNAFFSCPQPWCAHSYEVFAGDVAAAYGGPFALGCVRFSADLLARWPDAVTMAGELDIHPVHPPRSYAVMDSTLTQILRSCGVEVHQHYPNVLHHHAYIRTGTIDRG